MTKQEASVSPLTDEEVTRLRELVDYKNAPVSLIGPTIPNFPLAARIEARELKMIFAEGVSKLWEAIGSIEHEEDRKAIASTLEALRSRFDAAAEYNFYHRSDAARSKVPTPALFS